MSWNKPKKSNRAASSNEAANQLKVYRYPFSTATTTPKLPDGCTDPTLGLQYKDTRHLVFPADVETVNLCFYPGLNSWGVASYGATVMRVFTAGTVNEYRFLDGADNTRNNLLVRSGGDNTPSNLTARWRLVSMGFRLKNTNNDTQNQGYFESCRINASENNSTSILVEPNAATLAAGGTIGKTVPDSRILGHVTDAENWQNNASYMTGKIKDLYKYEGKLKPRDPVHTWVENPGRKTFLDNTQAVNNMYGIVAPNPNTQANADILAGNSAPVPNTAFNGFMDNNWDMVGVKLHGNAGTSVLVTTIANYEIQLDSDSAVNTFASKNFYSPKGMSSKFNSYRKETKGMSYVSRK